MQVDVLAGTVVSETVLFMWQNDAWGQADQAAGLKSDFMNIFVEVSTPGPALRAVPRLASGTHHRMHGPAVRFQICQPSQQEAIERIEALEACPASLGPAWHMHKQHIMRFGSTAKVLAECELNYYRISECNISLGGTGCASAEWHAAPHLGPHRSCASKLLSHMMVPPEGPITLTLCLNLALPVFFCFVQADPT